MLYSPDESSNTSQLIANNEVETSNQAIEFCCIMDIPIINPSNVCCWEITFSRNVISETLAKKIGS